jgi:hypothetical protein
MDFSKLPKLSESPAPPGGSQSQSQSQSPVSTSYATPVVATRASRYEYGLDAFIALVVGGIFLMLGMRFMRYLLGSPIDTGYVWPSSHPLANQPVAYWDLETAPAWGEMGFFVLGAASILSALLLLVATMSPRLRRPLLMFAIFLGVVGAGANVVAVIMQMKANIQPLISMIAILVGGMLAFFYGRHLVDEPAPAR